MGGRQVRPWQTSAQASAPAGAGACNSVSASASGIPLRHEPEGRKAHHRLVDGKARHRRRLKPRSLRSRAHDHHLHRIQQQPLQRQPVTARIQSEVLHDARKAARAYLRQYRDSPAVRSAPQAATAPTAAVGLPAGVGESCSGFRRAPRAPSGALPPGCGRIVERARRRVVEARDHGVGHAVTAPVEIHVPARDPRIDAGMHSKRVIVQRARSLFRRQRRTGVLRIRDHMVQRRGSVPGLVQAAGSACAAQTPAPNPCAARAPSQGRPTPPSHSSPCRASCR